MPTMEMPPMSIPISMVVEQESTLMSPARNFCVHSASSEEESWAECSCARKYGVSSITLS